MLIAVISARLPAGGIPINSPVWVPRGKAVYHIISFGDLVFQDELNIGKTGKNHRNKPFIGIPVGKWLARSMADIVRGHNLVNKGYISFIKDFFDIPPV
jgi:hypothetical protein